MLAFVLLYILSYPVLIGLVVLGTWAEAADSNASVFFGICAGTVAYFMFDVSALHLVIFGFAYFITGIVWSMYRYHRYVQTTVDNFDRHMSDERKKSGMEYVAPERMSERIVAWILVWPLSMIQNLTGDIVTTLKNLVTNTLKSIYAKIHANASSKVTFKEKVNQNAI